MGDRPQADPSPLPPEPLASLRSCPAVMASGSFSRHRCALNTEIFKLPLPVSLAPVLLTAQSHGLSGDVMLSSQSWTVTTPSCEGHWGMEWWAGRSPSRQGGGKRRHLWVMASCLCRHQIVLPLGHMYHTSSWASTSISRLSAPQDKSCDLFIFASPALSAIPYTCQHTHAHTEFTKMTFWAGH